MNHPYPRKPSGFDSIYEPCKKCDHPEKKYCIREDEDVVCIKECVSDSWSPQVKFEVGRTYKVKDISCCNTGQCTLHITGEDKRPHWFILKFAYQISGMSYRVDPREKSFFEFFEVRRLSRIKKLRKIKEAQMSNS